MIRFNASGKIKIKKFYVDPYGGVLSEKEIYRQLEEDTCFVSFQDRKIYSTTRQPLADIEFIETNMELYDLGLEN